MLTVKTAIFKDPIFKVKALFTGVIWLGHSAVSQLLQLSRLSFLKFHFQLCRSILRVHHELRKLRQGGPESGTLCFSKLAMLYNHHHKSVLEHFKLLFGLLMTLSMNRNLHYNPIYQIFLSWLAVALSNLRKLDLFQGHEDVLWFLLKAYFLHLDLQST